jgi:hypothetical protein
MPVWFNSIVLTIDYLQVLNKLGPRTEAIASEIGASNTPFQCGDSIPTSGAAGGLGQFPALPHELKLALPPRIISEGYEQLPIAAKSTFLFHSMPESRAELTAEMHPFCHLSHFGCHAGLSTVQACFCFLSTI